MINVNYFSKVGTVSIFTPMFSVSLIVRPCVTRITGTSSVGLASKGSGGRGVKGNNRMAPKAAHCERLYKNTKEISM